MAKSTGNLVLIAGTASEIVSGQIKSLALALGAIFVVWYWFSPYFTQVGYEPVQPVPYSHKLHAGQLGLDCYYCHSTVYKAAFAAVPATSTCMNCHTQVQKENPKLAPDLFQ